MNKKQNSLKSAQRVLRPLSDKEMIREVKEWLGGKKGRKRIEKLMVQFSFLSSSMFGLLLLLNRKEMLRHVK